MATNPTSAIPPFIPGLLIVSLLIVVCVSIGWRNYLRRGIPRENIVPRRWNWENLGRGQEIEGLKLEKPRMWEVGVSKAKHEILMKMEDGWESIMPLSATAIDHGLLAPEVTTDFKYSPGPPDRVHIRRFPDFSFLSHPSRTNAQPHDSQSVDSPTTLRSSDIHHLQLSVLISMPTPTPFIHPRPQNESDSPGADEHPHTESSDSPRRSKEDNYEDAEEIPEVAFGTIVVPWLKEEEEEFKYNHRKDSIVMTL